DHHIPATEGRGVIRAFAVAHWQKSNAELILQITVISLANGVDVWPVAVEGGVSGLPDCAGIFFHVAGDCTWGDSADPALGLLDCSLGLIGVGADGAVLFNEASATIGEDPLEGVAGETF